MDPGTGELSPNIVLSLFNEVARGAPLVISAYDRDGRFILQVGKAIDKLGLAQNQLVGVSVFEAFAGAEEALAHIRAALRGESSSNTQDLGQTVWDNWFSPLRDAEGAIIGAVSISTDVTERERARQQLEERITVIEAQTHAIRRLSVPIIQVWEDVLVVPVVGELGAERATQIMENLLSALTGSRARHAILDLTGVDSIDTETADWLLKILGAIRLLGVHGVVSGIGPAVAQTLIALGVDLSRVTTMATLHSALRLCMSTRESGVP